MEIVFKVLDLLRSREIVRDCSAPIGKNLYENSHFAEV